MIKPIRYKSTILKFTENAQKTIRYRSDDDILALALEVLRSNPSVNAPCVKPKNLFERIQNFLAAESQLTVNLDADKGKFFINLIRKINGHEFIGEKVPVNLIDLISKKNAAGNLLLKAKESVLEKIKEFNVKRKWSKVKNNF